MAMKRLICGRHAQPLEEHEPVICAVPVELTFSKIVQELVDNLRDDLVAEVRSLRDVMSNQNAAPVPTIPVLRISSADVQTQTVDCPMPNVHAKGSKDSLSGGTYTESSAPLVPPCRQIQETKAMAVPSPCRTCRRTVKAGALDKDLSSGDVNVPRDQVHSLGQEIIKLGELSADLRNFQSRAVDGIVEGVRRATRSHNRDQQFDALDAELSAHCHAQSRHETVEPEARRREVGGLPIAALRGQWTMTEEVRRLQEEVRRMWTTPAEPSNHTAGKNDVVELLEQQSALVTEISESRREVRDLATFVRGWQVAEPKDANGQSESTHMREQHGVLLRDIQESQQTLRHLALEVRSQHDGIVAEFGGEVRKLVSAADETSAHKLLVEDIQKRQRELEHTMTEEFRKVRAAIGAGLAALGASGVTSPALRQHFEGCTMPTPPSKGMPRASPGYERPTPGSDRVLHRV